jgi:hypothetical protein
MSVSGRNRDSPIREHHSPIEIHIQDRLLLSAISNMGMRAQDTQVKYHRSGRD